MSAAMPSRSPTSTPGCAWVKRASSPGTSTSPAGSSAPIQMRPRRTPRSSSTSARAPSTSARTRRARAAIASPASVGVTRRLVRSNSGVPSSCSSRRIWCDSADCARWSSSAARVKWRWRATASTLRNCRSSTRSIVEHDRCGENYVLHRSISAAHPRRHEHERRSSRPFRLLEPAVADDARLVDQLTGLVNDVYATAESGLWRDGTTRTTASELAELIRAGEIAVAARRRPDRRQRPAARRRGRHERVRDAGRGPRSARHRCRPRPRRLRRAAQPRARAASDAARAARPARRGGIRARSSSRPGTAGSGTGRSAPAASTTPIRTSRRCSPRRATSRSTRSRCRRAASAPTPGSARRRRRSRSGSA